MFPRAGLRGAGTRGLRNVAGRQKAKAIIDQRNLERKFDIKAKKSKKNYFKEEAKERKPKTRKKSVGRKKSFEIVQNKIKQKENAPI